MILACIVVCLQLAGIWCCREQFLVKTVEVQVSAHDGSGHLLKIILTGICVDLKHANNLEHQDVCCCSDSLHSKPWTQQFFELTVPLKESSVFDLDEFCNRMKFRVLERPNDLAATNLQQEGVGFNFYTGVDF